MVWDEVDRTARRQHGLITLSQLLGLGLSLEAIRHAVAERRLMRVRSGVFRLAGAPATQEQAWLAAVLAARGQALLSHRSAARAWAFKHFDEPDHIDLLVEGSSRARLEGVVAHRTTHLSAADRTRFRRIPMTTAERTFLDACGAIPLRQLGRSLDDALRREVIILPRLVRCLDTVPASGRRKRAPVAKLLEERVKGYDPGGSDAELNVLRILRSAGIRPLPVQQFRVEVEGRRFRVDFAWPATKHIIEFDGSGGHDTVSARHDDRERWRLLQRAGFTVWAVTEYTTRNEMVAIGVIATTSP